LPTISTKGSFLSRLPWETEKMQAEISTGVRLSAFGLFSRKVRNGRKFPRLRNRKTYLLERSIFEHRASGTILVAAAYEGSEIKQALTDFFRSAAGMNPEVISFTSISGGAISLPPSAD
jgi:hypothetical protein